MFVSLFLAILSMLKLLLQPTEIYYSFILPVVIFHYTTLSKKTMENWATLYDRLLLLSSLLSCVTNIVLYGRVY